MKGRTNQSLLRAKLQRRLRNNITKVEQRLWRCLRREQIPDFNEVMSDIDSVTAVIWRALQERDPTPIPAFPLKGKELR